MKRLMALALTLVVWGAACPASTVPPPALTAAAADEALREATAAAQRSLPSFRRRVEAETGLETVYGVRIRWNDTTEWLESIEFRGAKVSGIVDGHATAPTPKGPPWLVRTVPTTDIIDWVIVDDDGLHGGYTLRLERDRLSPADRQAFDRDLGAPLLPLP
jgi:uncharacterized protein YegJ (DUF2314 family)